MELSTLGWSKYNQSLKENIAAENVARVAVENRGGYLLYSQAGQLEGIVQGKFIKLTSSEADFPKVGDWVEIEKLFGEQKAIIKRILPRASKLSRQRISKDRSEMHQKQEQQIMATNIDIVFIVQGLDGDFNLARLERYLTAASNGGCRAVVLLNKCDVAPEGLERKKEVKDTFDQIDVCLVSAATGQGLENVRELIGEGDSVVFVGSSGVGKSTLINALVGIDMQKTQEVRLGDSKGRHTTTKRELFLLPGGGILIDTPGIRELAIWDEQNDTIKKPEKKIKARFRKNLYEQSDEE